MRTILLAAGAMLAALSATASAQGDAAPVGSGAPAATCYIEVRSLMAEPPAGIGELRTAIRALDTALRPQVVAINELKAQLARLEQREVQAAPSTSIEAAFADDDGAARDAPPAAADDRTAEQIRRIQAELDAKQAQLKLDYAAQQQSLIGPVQSKVSDRARAFAAQRQCAALKMARPPDLAALTAAGAQDVTGEFVAWYGGN